MPTTVKDVLVRAVMSNANGLPEDAVINDFAFRWIGTGNPIESDLNEVAGVVSGFYRTGTTSAAVGWWISETIDRGATHQLEVYSISAGGSPIYTTDWLGPPTVGATDNLPNEVAGVLSFHGDLTGVLEESGATRPRARRRGRVFIGPLIPAAVAISDPNPMLSTTFTATLRSKATAMYDDAETKDWRWCVWSRANDELYPVVGGWTDNAPDTQRRRGPKATGRNVFTT